ncbi:MAG: hypothetical protein O3C20_00990 [Verrucomicrobia bacterium]|nr:hypothetical protein [Verrucomicrobiota bacterium]
MTSPLISYYPVINHLSIKEINIPFNVSFKHASAERTSTQSIWITVRSDSGHMGHGESCPREYVTGESVASAIEFFERHHNSIYQLNSLDALISWMSSNKARIDEQPSAWCAIELALLDLFARESNQTVEALLGLPQLEGVFRYSAILGIEKPETFQKQLQQYLHLKFSQFKVKLSGNLEDDQARFQILGDHWSDENSLRLDANNLWSNPKEASRYLNALDSPFTAVEEPLLAGRFEEMMEVAQETGKRIILDESLVRLEQFENLLSNPEYWIINLRVSKMGGILRSLEIAEKATTLKIPLIIGAQVGETSLLTRAALTVAHAHRNNILSQEGAFGTYLLSRDITENPLMFGENGHLNPKDFLTPQECGFGISISHF